MPIKKFTSQQDAEIVKTYRDTGLSMRQIALKYNCSGATIKAILQSAKVELDKDSRKVNLYPFDYMAFNSINTEHAAYWLGFIYCDGHVRARPASLIVNLSIADIDHLRALAQFLQLEDRITSRKVRVREKHYNICTLVASNRLFASSLLALGVTPNGRDTTRIIASVPSDVRGHFIRGVFDANGCASKTRAEIIFCGDTILMTWIRAALHDLVGTSDSKKITIHSSGLNYLYYGGKIQCRKISDWMYQDATVFLARKRFIIDSYFERQQDAPQGHPEASS